MAAGSTLDILGSIVFDRGDHEEAESFYRRALEIQEKLRPESLDVADSTMGLAGILASRGDLAKAEELMLHAFTIREKLAPNSNAVADSLDQLASLVLFRGDLEKAEDDFSRALTIQNNLVPISLVAAKSLTGLGDLASARGDLAKAENYYRRALAIQQNLVPNGLAVSSSLDKLGNVTSARGDLARAQEYYKQALAIQEKLVPQGSDVAASLLGLGCIAMLSGDGPKAEGYFRASSAILERLAPGNFSALIRELMVGAMSILRGDPDANQSVNSLLAMTKDMAPGNEAFESLRFTMLGKTAQDQGDIQKAQEYYRQAAAIREKFAPGSLELASSYDDLGTVARLLGKRDVAVDYFHQALAIQEKVGSDFKVAFSIEDLGLIAWDRGDFSTAEKYYGEALPVFEKLTPGSQYHAEVLYSLGSIQRQKGQLEVASHYFERAIDALESQTARLGSTEEARASFRARHREYYSDYMETLLDLKITDRAFDVQERGRARSLLAMLAERDLVLGTDLPPNLEQARKANAKSYDVTYAQLSRLNTTKDAAEVAQLLTRLRDLQAEREQITEQIRRSSPRLAALQYPQPLDLLATRKTLDTGTAMLSYSVNKDKVELFVVLSMQEDPGLSVFTIQVDEKKLRAQIDEFRKLILERRSANDSDFVLQGRQLYDLVIKPAEYAIASSERLLVVPDGPLNSLPFCALLRTRNQYLVEWKPIHTVVSATVYAELKNARSHEAKPIELVALGDPQYPGNTKKRNDRTDDPDLRAATERGLTLSPLLFSRAEVDGITSLFPGRTKKYLGLEATEERAESIGMDVRYIHFAVHGILDNRLPLNSALVLTIPERITEGQEDGLLQAWKVFEQVHLDADLVVLSACNTGLGEELNGEGLIGLTRAFQYAGARSILASMWSVDDLRTMELMKHFYQGLVGGKTKDEALQSAQIGLLHAQPSSSPYYWAAFSLTGDWR